MTTANQDGECYFCIGLSSGKDIYAFAARAQIVDGAIVLCKKDGQMIFALASGQWEHCYVASSIDGSPVAIEHWTQDRRSVPPKKKTTALVSGARLPADSSQ